MPRHIDPQPHAPQEPAPFSALLGSVAMTALLMTAVSAGATQDDGKEVADEVEPSSETKAQPRPDVVGDIGLPIIKVAPVYPERAIKEGIEGHVLLEFVVTETGAVRDAAVLEAEPSGVFERAALKAVAKFKYKPRIVDGKPVETPGVRNRISFEISNQ